MEIIGSKTLNNSLSLLAPNGMTCVTGELGGEWELEKWAPMDHIKNETYLTICDTTYPKADRVRELFDFIYEYNLNAEPAHAFDFDKIRKAHEILDSSKAKGKIVIAVL